MEAVVTQLDTWKKRLEIEVSPEEIEPIMEKAYHSYQRKAKVKGFRKGKVPLSIIRQQFKKEIQAEVLDDLVQTFFTKAVEEKRFVLISPGVVQKVSFDEGKPFRFTAEVEVEPEVQVTDYKGLKAKKEVSKVTQEDVQEAIEILREQKAERRPVNDGAKVGHIVEGDVQALDSTGVPIIGKKWENRIFELGKPPLGDAVQDQLIGVVALEERRFKIVQNEPGPDGVLRDREDHYVIKVKSVEEKILPELNDNFVQGVSDFQTVSDLEAGIWKRLEEQRDGEAERKLHRQIADEIIRRNDFEVPPSMVKIVLDDFWKDYQNSPHKELDEGQFRQEYQATAVWNIKWYLLWRKVAEVEGINVGEAEVDAEIEKIAKMTSNGADKVRALYKDPKRRNRLKETLLEEKVMGFLKENAKIKEISVKKPSEEHSLIFKP